MISNQTRAARSFDFEITRTISDQIALHQAPDSTQFNLHRNISICIRKAVVALDMESRVYMCVCVCMCMYVGRGEGYLHIPYM